MKPDAREAEIARRLTELGWRPNGGYIGHKIQARYEAARSLIETRIREEESAAGSEDAPAPSPWPNEVTSHDV